MVLAWTRHHPCSVGPVCSCQRCPCHAGIGGWSIRGDPERASQTPALWSPPPRPAAGPRTGLGPREGNTVQVHPAPRGWGIRHPSHPVYAHPEQRASLWTLLEARLGKSSGEGRAPAAAALAAVMAVHHTHRTHTPCGTRPRRPVGPSPAPSSTGPKVTPVISRSTMISSDFMSGSHKICHLNRECHGGKRRV